MPFPFTCFCNKFKPCKTEYLGKYLLPQIDERRQQVAAYFIPTFFWRKEWDSLRDIISLHLLPLGSSYTSLIFIISLSLSRARKFICIIKMKTGYSRFPQAGVLRLDFRYRSNANDGNELPRTSSRHLSTKKMNT